MSHLRRIIVAVMSIATIASVAFMTSVTTAQAAEVSCKTAIFLTNQFARREPSILFIVSTGGTCYRAAKGSKVWKTYYYGRKIRKHLEPLCTWLAFNGSVFIIRQWLWNQYGRGCARRGVL